ncbi:Heterokaryon incompatibility protein (HET) domain containing protein [Naviculisporaceae sp. PSN 640]
MANQAATAESRPDYQYKELEENEVRFVTILPAPEFDDDIILQISHGQLPRVSGESQERSGRRRMSPKEVRETLPSDWKAFQSNDGRFLFVHYQNLSERLYDKTSWVHPDSSIDPGLYLPPEKIDSQPKYEALSYTWGSPSHTQDADMGYIIQATPSPDGTESFAKLSLTPNLASAIRHLRFRDRRRKLWIDAICINQESISERNAQVLRMVDIYRIAHRVVVWLGPSSSTSANALKTIAHLGKQTVYTTDCCVSWSPDATESPKWDTRTRLPYTTETFRSIADIYAREWFKRVWVVQEIQLARDAVVFCGHDSISWDRLWEATGMLLKNYHIDRSLLPTEHVDMAWMLGRKDFGARGSIETVLSGLGRLATEPRDLVYGLLGLLPPRLRSRIQPRYGSQNEWEAYRDVFLEHTEFVQRLEMTNPFNLPKGVRVQDSRPSWVPDLKNKSLQPWDFFCGGTHLAAGYSRSWVKSSYVQSETVGNRHLLALTVEGVQCATVSRVKDMSTPAKLGISAMTQAMRRLASEHSRGDSTSLYVTGETFDSALAKTFSQGYYKERKPGYNDPILKTWLNVLFSPATMSMSTRGALQPESATLKDEAEYEKLVRCMKETILPVFKTRPYFETKEGYVGVGPPDSQHGDIVVVLLGCDRTVFLRPNPLESNTFTVVGNAYTYGLGDATALLGPLPEPWSIQIFGDVEEPTVAKFWNAETGKPSEDDPRLGPLPDEWKRVYRDRTADDPYIFQPFLNRVTGETITHDPRMSPEALRARGVNLRTFTLV